MADTGKRDRDRDQDDNDGKAQPKKLGKLIVIIFILCAAAGGGIAGYMGLIPLPFLENSGGGGHSSTSTGPALKDVVFIDLPQIVIPLGENAKAKYLRAQFSIETKKLYEERVKTVQPRLMDMLNTYLRAVEEKELTDPARFQRLQAQMLRRARLVAGEDAIRNILVQEFVLQ